MNKLHVLAALFPLLGCSHSNSEPPAETIKYNTVKTSHVTNKTETNSDLESMRETKINNTASPKTESSKDLLDNVSSVPIQKLNEAKPVVKSNQLLDVVLIKQNPELKYGCEVTSLAMMLQYAGVKTSKMELYQKVQKDNDPLVRSQRGDILKWGDPDVGFVGDMTGKRAGYAVFDKPMIALIEQYMPGRSVNLTNKKFEEVLTHVSEGYPVVVWTTGDFRLPDRWESWYHGQKFIKTPLDLHAVVLVGYDKDFVYLNDPLSGRKQVKVGKQQFIDSWKALKSRAVSYKKG
ncbi:MULTISPECIES: C39 family peptidase [unclassified Bacillus (in: firmicutes)]|uniref:C39 family peptidase n=1 Tax=unclassified Bacillus (in: firmicutes) TaxID=185979 RepID=UPI0008F1FBDF|nr:MULTISPECIES: C39 family peptidase [unclassified Bacillus (in: firmicutes)]SFA76755.1 Uncharacterized protein YvpB [Bacillus sp. UNCCL13]SFQ66626.1 Uncharacterized protein YvpB [Bacillus sp. cl95]